MKIKRIHAKPLAFVATLALALLLVACSGQAAPTPTVPPNATAAATATPTVEPSPTATPTEVPDPEITFGQLSAIKPELGSFTQDEQGRLIYNSPLFNTEVGKNISVIQQYRETGLDGGPEVWLAPEKYPNAPIFIQDVDTGEIRQGPFRYDNDVRRRLTVPNSPPYSGVEEFKQFFSGTAPLAGTIGETRYGGIWSAYGITGALIGDQVEKDGHLVMAIKSYIGEEEDMLAFYYDLSLGPTDIAQGSWDPFYQTYVGENLHHYFLRWGILDNAGNFRGRYALYTQILVGGIFDVSSKEVVPAYDYSPNAFYSYENSEETSAILSILKSGGLPEKLIDSIDYEDLSLYGITVLVFR